MKLSLLTILCLTMTCLISFNKAMAQAKLTPSQMPSYMERAIRFVGKDNPAAMPKHVIMERFLHKITKVDTTWQDQVVIQNMLSKINLQPQSLEVLIGLGNQAKEHYEQLKEQNVACNYLQTHSSSANAKEMANVINHHQENMWQIYTNIFNNLDDYLPIEDVIKLKKYLTKVYVKKLHHSYTIAEPKYINLKHYRARCNKINKQGSSQ